jgi:hypothetical protein
MVQKKNLGKLFKIFQLCVNNRKIQLANSLMSPSKTTFLYKSIQATLSLQTKAIRSQIHQQTRSEDP